MKQKRSNKKPKFGTAEWREKYGLKRKPATRRKKLKGKK